MRGGMPAYPRTRCLRALLTRCGHACARRGRCVLNRLNSLVAKGGTEPPTQGFSVLCPGQLCFRNEIRRAAAPLLLDTPVDKLSLDLVACAAPPLACPGRGPLRKFDTALRGFGARRGRAAGPPAHPSASARAAEVGIALQPQALPLKCPQDQVPPRVATRPLNES
jgi:hypothetical protein